MSVAGWTVQIVRLDNGKATAKELWDCAIPIYREAEARVIAASRRDNIFLVRGVAPLTAERVRQLGLQNGAAKRRPP